MALKGQVVEKEVEVAKMDLEIARRDAVTSIRKAYWNLLFSRKALEITKEILALLTYLEEVATTRYESGKTSHQDVVKVRINREILEENLKTIKERQKNIEIGILALLNLPGDTRMGKPIQSKLVVTVPDLEKLFDLAKENRQEIRRLHAKIGKMERMVELAETMIFPSYSLNLSLNENDAVKSVGTFNQKETFPVSTTASRGAGLPKKSWYGSNDAYLRQTRQKIEALKANLKSLEDKTTVLVRNAWFNLDRSKREDALFANTVVELSKTTLDVSTRGYESGNVMFADVFASYDAWFKANLTLERKRNDIGIFWAELERVVGKRISHSKN
jgi:outer membrane protein TolC